MNKKISYTSTGHKHQLMGMEITNVLPNEHAQAVGHFVFLDYSPPAQYQPHTPRVPDGSFAHPHRGIATFMYVTHGEMEHYDSRGHHDVVGEGGAQWMKAGNGVIHDEDFSTDFQSKGGWGGALQFWINLPAAAKKEDPEYMAVLANDFPVKKLPDGDSVLKILLGDYAGQTSSIKTYAGEFMYHLLLQPGKDFLLKTTTKNQYAAFIMAGALQVADTQIKAATLVVFDDEGDAILIKNTSSKATEVMLFGGEPNTEKMVAKGPFVLNTDEEISAAYRDYKGGKYGTIQYEKKLAASHHF